ncbi:MAG: 50S ribosomal protein L23 [Elusimicrobia bacterium]|nr:50S ribosomal protein L23 [Elusimicrobiota bacterium]
MVTEKSTNLKEDEHQYSFVVNKNATKGDVARSVEDTFKVSVLKVRTAVISGKLRRMGRTQGYLSDWKKALVTIKAGQKIDIEKVG